MMRQQQNHQTKGVVQNLYQKARFLWPKAQTSLELRKVHKCCHEFLHNKSDDSMLYFATAVRKLVECVQVFLLEKHTWNTVFFKSKHKQAHIYHLQAGFIGPGAFGHPHPLFICWWPIKAIGSLINEISNLWGWRCINACRSRFVIIGLCFWWPIENIGLP